MNHEREAAAKAKQLRGKNKGEAKRAIAGLKRGLKKATQKAGRASRGQGSFIKRGVTPRLLCKKHKGGIAGDRYAEKKATESFSNTLSQDAKSRKEEFELEYKRHPKCDPKNMHVHYSLSLPPGQQIETKQWKVIVKDFMNEIDAGDCAFSAHVHNDTDSQHVHVIFSRSKGSGALWRNSNDYYRMMEGAGRVAERHLGGRTMQRPGDTPPAPASDREENAKRMAARQKKERQDFIDGQKIKDAVKRSRSITEFQQHLHAMDIQMSVSRSETGQVRGVLFKNKGSAHFVAGTSINRDLSIGKIVNQIKENSKTPGNKQSMAPGMRQQNQMLNQSRRIQAPTIRNRQRGF